MGKAAATVRPETKIRIRKRVFLGEFKLEDFLQKQVLLLVEKSK